MNKVRSFMMDMIIMLTATAVVAVYTYGIRALWSILLSVVAAVMTEVVGYIVFMKRNPTKIADFSAVFTGLAVALALPSAAPFWLAPLGAAFAIAVAKLPFGDSTSQPFVPAAAGIAFVTLSYPQLVFAYPSLSVGKLTTVSTAENFLPGTSLAQMLAQSRSIGTNLLNVIDVLVGRVPGPMGASCLIIMIGTLLYLIIRKSGGAVTAVSFLFTCAAIAFFFPRVMSGRLYSIVMELGAGLLFYSAVFFLSDPATSPRTSTGRILYGATAGILTMLLRYFGAYEESVIFVVLIVNAISDVFDNLAGISVGRKRKAAAGPEKAAKEQTKTLKQTETGGTPGGPAVSGSKPVIAAAQTVSPEPEPVPSGSAYSPVFRSSYVPQGVTFGNTSPLPELPKDNPPVVNAEQAYAADLVGQVVRETVLQPKPAPDDNPEITAEVEALLAQIMGSKGEGGAENNEQK